MWLIMLIPIMPVSNEAMLQQNPCHQRDVISFHEISWDLYKFLIKE